MIIEYHRPESLSEALQLLGRQTPPTLPLGGGTVLSQKLGEDIAVVDLQRLGLNQIQKSDQVLKIGAAATLQALLETNLLPVECASALNESLLHEVAINVRRAATLAGTIVCCDGRSPLVTALLALDAQLVWAAAGDQMPLEDYLPLREKFDKSRLMIQVKIPADVRLRFSMVARSPMDRPIVCAVAATWPSGRTRVTLGGFGSSPTLVMDGLEAAGAVVAAREAYSFAGDAWASAEYRKDIAAKLVQRLITD